MVGLTIEAIINVAASVAVILAADRPRPPVVLKPAFASWWSWARTVGSDLPSNRATTSHNCPGLANNSPNYIFNYGIAVLTSPYYKFNMGRVNKHSSYREQQRKCLKDRAKTQIVRTAERQ